MDEQLQNELEEQARLLGMSAERECDLRGKLERERALADRLAEGLRKMVLYSEALILRIQDRSDINFKTLNECIDLFNEWEEARSE